MSICMRRFVQSCAPAMGRRMPRYARRGGHAGGPGGARGAGALPSFVERAASGTMSAAAQTQPTVVPSTPERPCLTNCQPKPTRPIVRSVAKVTSSSAWRPKRLRPVEVPDERRVEAVEEGDAGQDEQRRDDVVRALEPRVDGGGGGHRAGDDERRAARARAARPAAPRPRGPWRPRRRGSRPACRSRRRRC